MQTYRELAGLGPPPQKAPSCDLCLRNEVSPSLRKLGWLASNEDLDGAGTHQASSRTKSDRVLTGD